MAADFGLNEKQLNYVCDRDFLLTKHKIGKKVNRLLLATESALKAYIRTNELYFPQDVKFRAGKIARGENYRLLPYYMLDFPRQFDQQSIFALRTMFWWGHPFSVTLHLAGLARARYLSRLRHHRLKLAECEALLYQREDNPWQHHLAEENYQPINKLTEEDWQQQLQTLPHIKLAVFMPLEQWNHLPDFTIDFFDTLAEVLALKA
jgi:hypothetical protein